MAFAAVEVCTQDFAGPLPQAYESSFVHKTCLPANHEAKQQVRAWTMSVPLSHTAQNVQCRGEWVDEIPLPFRRPLSPLRFCLFTPPASQPMCLTRFFFFFFCMCKQQMKRTVILRIWYPTDPPMACCVEIFAVLISRTLLNIFPVSNC
jgi:hypothetical protein